MKERYTELRSNGRSFFASQETGPGFHYTHYLHIIYNIVERVIFGPECTYTKQDLDLEDT